ncbi:protein Hook homolog 2-like isoform X2 [Osmerus eperlanus]|uniref:protein Hook homolog 2-like isoform X2 n=1 Tax=Osmerus eperlanus TaxID=29151 RepID=UPI002E0FE8E6
MSLYKTGLCDSLLNWLQTFQVPSCSSKQDLTSGVAVAHVLNRLDPSWFNEAWLGRIKEESGDNWRLKVSNLRKILQSLLEYYHDVLGHQVLEAHLPDVSLIGEMGDEAELGKLVQLVLGCAVSGEKKQEQIQQIMTLEESVQHVVMAAIQELLAKEPSEPGSPETYGDFDNQSRKYYFLSEEVEEKEDLGQRCKDLEQQLLAALEERSSLQAEARALRERLIGGEPPDAATAITAKKLLLLQSQMEQVQEENYRLETSRDDLCVRRDVLEREMMELQHRNEELTSLAQEAQSLKDEMDILRHSSDKVSRLEAMVETYRRRLEDLGDLRRQVKLLEERNTIYMQRTCQLEEEQHRSSAIRTQLDTYQRQVHELTSKHACEAVKAEKWQFEYKNLQEKHEALLMDKERLISERDALRETNEELRCSQVQQNCLSQSEGLGEESGTLGNLASEIMSTEFRDTVVGLQRENRALVEQEEGCRRRLALLEEQLEETQRTHNTLETQSRLDQQLIRDLRSQVERLQSALQEQGSKTEDSSLLQKKLEEHLEKLHEAHSDLQKKKEVIDDLEPKVDDNMARKIDELQQTLQRKEEDMRVMEDRYKRYVEKARTVIKTLDPQQQPLLGSPDIQSLKNQLTEKERKIQHLEGMALHQRVAGERGGERTGAPGQAQSFLAQQRQSTSARRGRAGRSYPR